MKLYVNGVLDAASPDNLYPALNSTVYVYVPYWGVPGQVYVDELHILKAARPPVVVPTPTPTPTPDSLCGDLTSIPPTTSWYYTDPSPTLVSSPTEIVLRKELYGYGNYGVADGRSDILYTDQAATWEFTLPPSIDPAAVQEAFFRVSLIADDHYGMPLSDYVLATWTNEDQAFCASPSGLPHGEPYGTRFTNWVQLDYAASVGASDYSITLANRSDTYSGDWFAVDWIELHLLVTPLLTCHVINARDFDGVLVTGAPTDGLQWFTWLGEPGTGEAETYEEARVVYSYVNSNIYPEVSVQANVSPNTYRLWIYQHDESLDRSLETTVGSDTPVRTTFDSGVEGNAWKWLDVGVHVVDTGTVIKTKAVGDFGWHGQPFRQRRGGFMTMLLTTDLGSNPPDFTPDGQTSGSCDVGNLPSAADAGGPYTGDEGSPILLDASGSTDPDDNIVLYEWDLDDDGEYDDVTGVIAEAVFSDNGDYIVGLRVTDEAGESDTDTADVTVLNVAPAVDAGAGATISEGGVFTSSGSFADPGADTWTATVDYGDGSGSQPLALNSDKTFDLSQPYVDDGIYTVTVEVCDDESDCGSDTLIVAVSNVAPTVDAGPDAVILSGQTLEVEATFTDPGVLDTHTATIDFGTGAGPEPATVVQGEGSGTVSGSHRYLVPGFYSVEVCVTDDDGDVGCDTLIVEIEPYPVTIDIKPGSDPNSINLKSKGKVPVAVLTTDDFDAGDIDPETVRFADAAQVHWALEDMDGDGDLDLVLHFKTQELNLNQDSTEATLTGSTTDGAVIEDSDAVNIVPKGK